MTRYDDDDFDNDVVPVSGGYASTLQDVDEYNEQEDNQSLVKKLNALNDLATTLRNTNSRESLSNLKYMTDFLGSAFINTRLKNGLISEDIKKSILNRFNELMPSCTPQELTDMFRAISDAGVPDLDRIFGPRSGGINITMQGGTTNHNVYDNHVENQLNQTQQNVYANDKAIKELTPAAIGGISKFAEAAGIFKQVGVPRQNQVEYKPEEKLPTVNEKVSEMIDANFEEIKAEEKKYMNED